MNITFEPSKDAVRVSFVEGDVTRTVETAQGVEIRIGAGKLGEADRRSFIKLVRKPVRIAREQKIVGIQIDARGVPGSASLDDMELGRLMAENLIMADYEFTKYKTKKADDFAGVATVVITDANENFKKGAEIGTVVGEAINHCRDLANTPGGDMTPRVLAEAGEAMAKGTPIKVEILDKSEIKKLKMGLVLGVAQGSVEEPKFIVMEYWGADKSEKPIVLVGKGVTFDSGGINLKPETGMVGMQHDMAGGASVMTAVTIAARLKLKKNVVALVPAVENMPSGAAIRPGDVLMSMNGKTVEVLNTDAEGRLILGDALTYAEKYSPKLVLDVATLTGAALIALGMRASAILTRDAVLETILRQLGEKTGEYVWPFPLWKEYEAEVKSVVADIANVPGAGPSSRYGGVINGGTFLQQFAGAYTWAHIDMAPRQESIPEDNLARGATGAPVRLLVSVIENY